MSWDHDDGFFDEAFDNTPEGFSDFQDEWGATDSIWDDESDASSPAVVADDGFADEPAADAEAMDEIDREWLLGEGSETRDEAWETDGAGADSPGDAMAVEAAESGDWSAFEEAGLLPGDGDDKQADEDDEKDDPRHGL